MAWKKFDPARIYRWTVAAKAIRDAKKGGPREEDCATGPAYVGGIDVCLTFYEWELVWLAKWQISRLLERWERRRHIIAAEAKRVVGCLEDPFKQFVAHDRRHEAEGFREPHRRLRWAYLPLMAILGLVEMPFNISGLKILQLGNWELWLLAAGPSVAFQVIAHHLGDSLRRWPHKPDWRTRGLFAMEIASLLGLIVAMGVLRAKYIAWATSSPPDWSNAFLTMSLNLVIVTAAVAMSFFFHDQDGERELEKVVRQKQRALKRLNRVWKRWERLAGSYDKHRGVTLARIMQAIADCVAKILEYRDRNSLHRDAPVPSSFQVGIVPEAIFRERDDVGGELTGLLPSLDDLLRRYRQAGPEVPRRAQDSLDELFRWQEGGKTNEIPCSVQEGDHEAV